MMTDPFALALDDFIDGYQPIAAVIGPDKARDLAAAFGGQRLYVPTTWRLDLEMNRVIGNEAGRTLCERFGPEQILIPMMPWRLNALHRLARQMRDAGRTQNEAAAALGVSYKTIQRAARSVERPLTERRRRVSDDRQTDLEAWLKKTAS